MTNQSNTSRGRLTEAEERDIRTEHVARVICARALNGFCKMVGGSIGCKVGRGSSDATECAASVNQLVLSGTWTTAGEIIAALQEQKK